MGTGTKGTGRLNIRFYLKNAIDGGCVSRSSVKAISRADLLTYMVGVNQWCVPHETLQCHRSIQVADVVNIYYFGSRLLFPR
jgi:hypothetical protein